MSDDHHYLAEIRKQSAGGKVTVYRNREWILKALDDGVTKRAIYTILHEREGLAIGITRPSPNTSRNWLRSAPVSHQRPPRPPTPKPRSGETGVRKPPRRQK